VRLILFWLLLLVSLVSAQSPLEYITLIEFPIIDFVVVFIIFVFITHWVLKDHFGKHVPFIMSFVFAFGIVGLGGRAGFDLGSSGMRLGAILIVVFLGLVYFIFRLVGKVRGSSSESVMPEVAPGGLERTVHAETGGASAEAVGEAVKDKEEEAQAVVENVVGSEISKVKAKVEALVGLIKLSDVSKENEINNLNTETKHDLQTLRNRFGKEYIGKIKVKNWCDDNLVLISKMFKDYGEFLNRQGVNTNIDGALKDFKKRVDEFVTNITNAIDNSEFTAEKSSALTVTHNDLDKDIFNFREGHKKQEFQGVLIKTICDKQLDRMRDLFNNYSKLKSNLETRITKSTTFADLVGEIEKFVPKIKAAHTRLISDVDNYIKNFKNPGATP
jgi:hypothetical protein